MRTGYFTAGKEPARECSALAAGSFPLLEEDRWQ